MKKIFFVLSMFLVAISINAQDLPKIEYKSLSDKMPFDPNVKIGQLPNGIKYYIRANSKPENRAYLQIVVKAGSIDEDDDQKGLAHFIEHMCFNGTKNFPKNDLVKYLESTGMRFGADLNANTSFDRTYYLLQVPTDNAETFEKGFQVLQDWASNVSFDPEELEKERRVILEEWRLYRGAQERIMKQHYPYFFFGSKYADRDVIGDTAVIMHAPRETFLRYYKDWYRPNLMSVILVGDFDQAKAEQLLMKYFAPLKNPDKPRAKEIVKVPIHNDAKVSIATDKEMPYSMVQMIFKKNAIIEGDFASYRSGILARLSSTMLNMRMQELTRKANPPYFTAGGGYDNDFMGGLGSFSLFTIPKAEDVNGGIKATLEEAFRAAQHGFTSTELERAKTSMLKGMEKAYAERDKSESEDYADEYMRNFMFGEGMPGIAYEYAFYQKELPNIKLEEINSLTKGYLENKGLVIAVSMPEKEGSVPPTKESILQVYNETANAKYDAYIDKTTDEPLVKTKPVAGSIKSTKAIPSIDAKELTLSNGAKVIYKKTDFKNDEVIFQAFSLGGLSLAKTEDIYTAASTTEIIGNSGLGKFDETTLGKMLQGKIARVYPFINDLYEGFGGSYAPVDMETFFQILYSNFTQPRKDEEAFKSYITTSKDMLETSKKDPSGTFRDSISYVMANYNKREKPLEVADFDKVNLDKAFQFFKERFNNAGDFTFVFVGNIDEAKFIDMVNTYIASLPTNNSKENFIDHKINPPKGHTTKYVYKGVDDKASVSLKFFGDYKYNTDNNFKLKSLIEYFNIKLIETIREDKSGVYGIGARPSMNKYPTEDYMISVGFGTEPARVDELIKAVESMMESFKKTPPTKEDLEKVKEIQKKELEKNYKENNFWLGVIFNSYFNGIDPNYMNERMKQIEKLTVKDIQDAAKKYFVTKNYAKFILYPENYKK